MHQTRAFMKSRFLFSSCTYTEACKAGRSSRSPTSQKEKKRSTKQKHGFLNTSFRSGPPYLLYPACPSRSPHIPSHHTTRLYMRVPPSVVTVLRDFFSSSSFRDIKIVTSVDIVRCRQHMPFVGSSSQALQEGATFSVAEWGQVFCLPASSELKTTDSVPRLVIDCTHTCLLDS